MLQAQLRTSVWHNIYFFDSPHKAAAEARSLGRDWRAARVVHYEATEVVAL
jgi:hypothetical protein